MPDTPGEDAELSVDDLFGLLGSEPRMAIMQVLWDGLTFSDYVTGSMTPLSFSVLRERTEAADPGNFNYHLQTLEGITIERTDEGYQLTPLGYNLMRMIERYTSFEYQQILPTVLERACPFCGGELVGRYERELVHVRCRDCWGLGDEGTINYVQLPSPSLGNLELPWLLDIATMEMEARIRYTETGVCPECFTQLNRELDVCADHATAVDGQCSHCPNRFASVVDAQCPACGWGGSGPTLEFALLDSAVRATFDKTGRGPQTVGPWAYRLNALSAVEETVTDPEQPRTTFQFVIDEEDVQVEVGE